MKKLLLSIVAIFIGFIAMSQTCVPDTSFKTPGIYPISGGSSTGFYVYMPDAEVGLMYNQVIQIKAPSDTIVDTMGFQIPATIDTIQIIGFSGMPASISYQCDNADCIWLGGDNGCATFTGVPTQAEVGLHVIDIVAVGSVNVGIFGTLTDTIKFKMELKVVPKTGINEFLSSASVKLFPNPTSNFSKLSFQAVSANPYNLRLIDVTGRTVRTYNGQTKPGFNELLIERNGLPNGLYFYSLEIGGEAVSGRMAITD